MITFVFRFINVTYFSQLQFFLDCRHTVTKRVILYFASVHLSVLDHLVKNDMVSFVGSNIVKITFIKSLIMRFNWNSDSIFFLCSTSSTNGECQAKPHLRALTKHTRKVINLHDKKASLSLSLSFNTRTYS